MGNGHEFELKLEIAAKKLCQQREFLNDYLLLIFSNLHNIYMHKHFLYLNAPLP